MKLLLIGSPTGDPSQLKFSLKDVDIKNICVVIAQHISASFIPSFVNQFNKEALSEVSLLNDKEVLTSKIYICQKDIILSGNLNLMTNWKEVVISFKPNVDLLFHSAVPLVKTNKILTVILIGMGDDGARGLSELYKVGVKCLYENEADSIVYGMPKEAKDINPKLRPMSLKEIKQEILNFVNEE